MTTFVCVGNMKKPFFRLVDIINQHSKILPKPIIFQHGHTPIAIRNCFDVEFFEFFNSVEFNQYIQNATLCIGHAGAGFVSTCLLHQKQPMLLARKKQFDEHIDDHQVEFSNYLFQERIAYEFSTNNLIEYNRGKINLSNKTIVTKRYCDDIEKVLDLKIGKTTLL